MFEFTKKPKSAALAFIIAGAFWFIVGTFYGLFSAIHLMAPEFFNNIPALVFGRTRPIHVNTVLYGFVVSTLIGSGLYYMPALLKRNLWSEPLAWLSFLLWNITVLSGPLTFSFGMSQGREYQEYLWIFDVMLVIAILTLIVNLVMTILTRVENRLYVSVWYFVSSFLWIGGSYFLGNVMWNPPSGALPGILDSIFLWFYGHVLPGLLLTPLAIGAAYFVVPRSNKNSALFPHLIHPGILDTGNFLFPYRRAPSFAGACSGLVKNNFSCRFDVDVYSGTHCNCKFMDDLATERSCNCKGCCREMDCYGDYLVPYCWRPGIVAIFAGGSKNYSF